MRRTFFTLALMTALLLARGAGATPIDLDTVHNVTGAQDGNPCVTVGNCVDSTNRGMIPADVTPWDANLSSVNSKSAVVDCSRATQATCQDNAYGNMDPSNLGGTGNRRTGNQGPSTNIQSSSSGLFATPATLSLLAVACLSLGLVLRRLL